MLNHDRSLRKKWIRAMLFEPNQTKMNMGIWTGLIAYDLWNSQVCSAHFFTNRKYFILILFYLPSDELVFMHWSFTQEQSPTQVAAVWPSQDTPVKYFCRCSYVFSVWDACFGTRSCGFYVKMTLQPSPPPTQTQWHKYLSCYWPDF